MGNVNLVVLMGNITRDPEVRNTESGAVVCKFGMAINERKKGRDGQYQDVPVFVDLVAFNKTAESIGNYFSKGRSIHVQGRLNFNSWQAQDGSKRSKLEVIVDRWQFPDRKPTGAPNHEGAQQQQAGQQQAGQQQQGYGDGHIPF